jgi:hypothetical protein
MKKLLLIAFLSVLPTIAAAKCYYDVCARERIYEACMQASNITRYNFAPVSKICEDTATRLSIRRDPEIKNPSCLMEAQPGDSCEFEHL